MSVTLSRKHFKKGFDDTLTLKHLRNAAGSMFGDRSQAPAVSSTKSMTGHLLGAAGAIESIACLLTLTRGTLPPTINYETPDSTCDLDYVPHTSRQLKIQYALSNSFGFGGTNAALLFKRYEG